jgi:hypothetical protein
VDHYPIGYGGYLFVATVNGGRYNRGDFHGWM